VKATLATIVGVVGLANVSSAQGDVHQLAGRLAPHALAAIQRIADSAAAGHLPVQPIVDKASEGAVKGVPPDRIIGAASLVLHQLGQSATAIRAGGVTPEPEAIEAGAVALDAGLGPEDVQAIVQRTRAPYTPAATLRVGATLAALGLSGSETVNLVRRAMDSHQLGDLLDLPREVQAEMASGSSASDAAARVSHGESSEGGAGAGTAAHGAPTTGHSHKP
jgi:hypothetical protein